jgi:twitching motility two-component system response regulator PilH
MNGSKKVVVADDSPTVGYIIGSSLMAAGYEVELANDGVEAIAKVYATRPDLVLLDIDMPKMNGYQVCRLLKEDKATSHIPIIILTSRDQQQDRFWGLSTGADEYMIKDMDTDVLLERVEHFLATAPPAAKPGYAVPDEVTEASLLERVNTLLDLELFQSTIVNELGSLVTKMRALDETVSSVFELLSRVVDLSIALIVLDDEPEPFFAVYPRQELRWDSLLSFYNKTLAGCAQHGIELRREVILQALAPVEEQDGEMIRTFAAFSLRSRDAPTGLLAIGSWKENAISDDVRETLELFAHEASIVLDNALLYYQLERSKRQLQETLDELLASQAREKKLREEIEELRIEIDQVKRERQVAEITESDYFQTLRQEAQRIRAKREGDSK